MDTNMYFQTIKKVCVKHDKSLKKIVGSLLNNLKVTQLLCGPSGN